MRVLHVEVRQEHHFHEAVDVGIVVHRRADGGDEPDDPLGHEVAGRGLAAEDERARRDCVSGVLLEPVVQSDDVQSVEVLALVLVDPLDLDVEHPGVVQFDTGGGVHELGEPPLVGPLDLSPALPERRILDVVLQPAQLVEIGQPAVADGVVEQRPQSRVGQGQEPSRGDAVGHIAEPVRPQLVEVFEHTGFQQLRVQRRHTVDRVAADGGQVRHPHALAVVLADERHPRDAVLVAWEP